MKSRVLLLALAAAVAGAAYGQQYRWIDEKGRVQYTDTLPPASAKSVQKKNFKGNSVGAQPSYALDRAARVAPVTLYTHPICKEPCQVARDVLAKRGVPFTEVVATEADKVEQLKKVSGSDAVPVLVVGDYVERTISPETYNRALDRAGYPSAALPASR